MCAVCLANLYIARVVFRGVSKGLSMAVVRDGSLACTREHTRKYPE